MLSLYCACWIREIHLVSMESASHNAVCIIPLLVMLLQTLSLIKELVSRFACSKMEHSLPLTFTLCLSGGSKRRRQQEELCLC